jgi:DcmR-like sensory protein
MTGLDLHEFESALYWTIAVITERARSSGIRFEFLRMRPHDHIGWAFTGTSEFAALAAPFLAEGAALGERTMYVAQNPDPRDMAGLADVGGPGGLMVRSTADVYGTTGIVDAQRQHAAYTEAVEEALAAGFSGVRVAADATPLVATEERLAAFLRWEVVADRMLSEYQITAMCAFDQEQVDASTLRRIAALHPLSSASGPQPQFRLFSADGDLWAEGQLGPVAVMQLWRAIEDLPRGTGVQVDLSTATLTSHAVLTGLGQLCRTGVPVTIRGESAAIGKLRRWYSSTACCPALQEA